VNVHVWSYYSINYSIVVCQSHSSVSVSVSLFCLCWRVTMENKENDAAYAVAESRRQP